MLSQQFKRVLDELARGGIYIGTSSWKYPSVGGQPYDEQRYLTRGKFSEAKLERECLAEYAQTFSIVCVDAGYYKFPTEKWIEGLCGQVKPGIRFIFKVTDAITIKSFLNQPRYGARAGKPNEHFLNADLFRSSFLHAFEPFRDHICAQISEFSQFRQWDFEHGRDFVARLDAFLDDLSSGWQYAPGFPRQFFQSGKSHRQGAA